MTRFDCFCLHIVVIGCVVLSAIPSAAAKKKQLPSVRWTAGAPGCTFERTDDGHYRWTMTGKDLTVVLMLESQELAKSRHRFYGLLGAFVGVTYTGQNQFEFPADVRVEFSRHHDYSEALYDPSELSTKLQNDVDTFVFETERKIKKDPKIADAQTERLRKYQSTAAEFIEFLSTKTLDPKTIMLNSGNREAYGWVFFATTNKWIGPWKEREDFIFSLWMKDKIWQFPVSLPPTKGDPILEKPQE